MQWDAHRVSTNSRPKATGSRTRFVSCQSMRHRPPVIGSKNSFFNDVPRMIVKRGGSLVETACVPLCRNPHFSGVLFLAASTDGRGEMGAKVRIKRDQNST